jgi:hypothetical protein
MMQQSHPFRVSGWHDGLETTSYRYYRDGVLIAEKLASARVDGIIAFDEAAGLPRGSYTLRITAVNDVGESLPSEHVLVVTGPVPSMVGLLTIIVLPSA